MAFPLKNYLSIRRPLWCPRDYTLGYEAAMQTVLRSRYEDITEFCRDRSIHIIPRKYLSAALSDLLLSGDQDYINTDEQHPNYQAAREGIVKAKYKRAVEKACGDEGTVDIVYATVFRRLLRNHPGATDADIIANTLNLMDLNPEIVECEDAFEMMNIEE